MGLKGFLLVGSFLLLGLTSAQDCCQKKVVTAPADHAGTYTFLRKFDGDKDSNCFDSCIYSKEGEAGEEYCFKAVDTNPATIDDQCDATTGPTSAAPTGPTTPAPTTVAEDPATEIKKANEEIAENNKEIEAESENKNTASSATTTVDGIANALAETRKKRQSDSPTIAPLASISECPNFGDRFKELLSNLKQLDGDNADEKIPTIKELVRILNEALPTLNTICTKEKKNELKANTTADVQTAKEKTTKYKEKKEKKIQDLVVKVQIAQEKIKVSNEKLVASGSTKIPALTIPIIAINFTVANPFSYVTQLPPEPTTPIGSSPNGQGTSPGQGSSAPGGSTPGGSSPGGSSPGGSSPGGSSPGGSSPGGTSPGGSSPGGSSPGGSSPGGSSPGGSSPGGTSPGGSSPGGTSPGGSSPDGSSPGGSSPGGSSPGGTSPGGTSPGGSSPGGSSPGGSSPGGSSPGGSSPGTSPRPSTTRGPGRLNMHFKDFKKFHQ